MIKSVLGKSNTADVKFTSDGTIWQAEVPAGDVAYCVEIWAEDFAGNESYISTILITYDLEKLCFKFEITDTAPNWQKYDVMALFTPKNLELSTDQPQVDMEIKNSDVQLKIMKKECG